MRGRQVLIEPLPAGGHAAALMVDGRLEDLLIDPDPTDPTPRPEAIHRAVAARPMKGTGGVIVDLGQGRTGFLRGPRLPPPASAPTTWCSRPTPWWRSAGGCSENRPTRAKRARSCRCSPAGGIA